MTLGSHVLSWWQTRKQTRRLASARRAPPKQYKRYILIPARRPTRPVFRREGSALPCRDDVLVENSAAAPKSCLPSLEMRTTTAAGDLLPTGEIFTVRKTTFNKSPLRLYQTEETNSKETNLWASVPPAWYDSSFRKLLAVPSCRRVIETKSIQNRTFDPGGSQGRLRAWPFFGTWRALLCGEAMRVGAAGDELQRFLED